MSDTTHDTALITEAELEFLDALPMELHLGPLYAPVASSIKVGPRSIQYTSDAMIATKDGLLLTAPILVIDGTPINEGNPLFYPFLSAAGAKYIVHLTLDYE